MGSISWVRVIVGGLVTGFVINVSEFLLNEALLGRRWAAAMESLGKPAPGGAAIGIFVAMGFLLGIAAVFLYALIRPRLGAGPKTAVSAGLLVWFFAYFYSSIGVIATGVFPATLPLAGMVWGRFELPVATVFGAWMYGEATSQ